MHPRHLLSILKDAASDWVDDGAMRLSSSLAYYAIFSLAPLLVIVISMAGLVFGEDAARGQLSHQIATLAGTGAGEAIQSAVQSSAAQKSTGVWATVLSTAVLLFGASTVFAELKDALNMIWGVVVKPGLPFFTLLHDRFFSFSIVLAIGFLLLVSLVISVLLAALGLYISGRFQPAEEGQAYASVMVSLPARLLRPSLRSPRHGSTEISRLRSMVYSPNRSAKQAAGFHVAVWEIGGGDNFTSRENTLAHGVCYTISKAILAPEPH